MKNNKAFAGLGVALVIVLVATQVPTVERHVLGAGGQHLAGATISVDNTLGQPVAGTSSAGAHELCAGFWCAAGDRPAEGQAPVAGLDADPRLGPAPLEVQFTDTSAYTPTAWLWTFGDGGISAAQHPLHVYTVPGSYTVTLGVSNAYGSDEATRPDYIQVTTRDVYLPLVVRSRP